MQSTQAMLVWVLVGRRAAGYQVNSILYDGQQFTIGLLSVHYQYTDTCHDGVHDRHN